MSDASSHVAIVGAGHAGGRVVQHLRDLGFAGRITLIGDEPHAPYERPALSKEVLLDKADVATLTLAPSELWSRPGVCDRVVGRVDRVRPGARSLTLDDGRCIEFDTLVLASGGKARRLSLPGADLPGVHTLRTIDDSLSLKSALADCRRLVVIGAGVIGMEVAASAAERGVAVTVLEGAGRILQRCLPAPAAAWLANLHDKRGVSIHTGVAIQAIESGTGGESALQVQAVGADGASLACPADLVLMAVGIDCELGYLDGSGIAVDNGVAVDAYCRSPGLPWVYAVGDAANTPNPVVGGAFRQETWRNAENQARAVAEFIQAGRAEPYVEIPWMWTDQYERNIQVVGMPGAHDEIVERVPLGDGAGSLIWLRDGVVAGGMLIDSGRDRKALEALVQRGARIAPNVLADTKCRLKDLS